MPVTILGSKNFTGPQPAIAKQISIGGMNTNNQARITIGGLNSQVNDNKSSEEYSYCVIITNLPVNVEFADLKTQIFIKYRNNISAGIKLDLQTWQLYMTSEESSVQLVNTYQNAKVNDEQIQCQALQKVNIGFKNKFKVSLSK